MKAWTQVGKFEDTSNQGSRIAATASGDMALFRTEANACLRSLIAVRIRRAFPGYRLRPSGRLRLA